MCCCDVFKAEASSTKGCFCGFSRPPDPAPERVGYKERGCNFGHNLNAPFACCMSSVLSRLKKTWLQKGAEQKAKCDIHPARNGFSQELLSAARMLLWIVRRHRGISHHREWLQDNLSNSVCGDPLGGAERILFTARRTQITFSVFSFSSSWCFLIHCVCWTEAKLSCCFYGCGLFSSQGQSQNRRPKPDTNAGAQRHVSRAELWEILRHIEVSETQIRPTPGTFYFCFSDSPGHTQRGDLLNKMPPGTLK